MEAYPSSTRNVKPGTELVSEIVALHGEIITAARTSMDKAIRIGELLTGIKADLRHGEWLRWLKDNIPFAERTARNYMRCHAERDRLKSANVADLAEAYRLLAPPPERDAIRWDELETQQAADFARFRVFDLRLNSSDLTIKECRDIKNEATGMEGYWRKVSFEAERNLGLALNEAEKLAKKLGISQDEALAEINRLLKESDQDPASTFSGKATA